MERIFIKDEYIKLGQAMKLAALVENGAAAKLAITEGRVKVNGEEEQRRGRKIREGDIIEYGSSRVLVCR